MAVLGLTGKVGANFLLFLIEDVDTEGAQGLDEIMGVGAEVDADEGEGRCEGNRGEGVCGHAVEAAAVVQGGYNGNACSESGHTAPEIILTYHKAPVWRCGYLFLY